jgi:threonine aldolase
MSAPVGGLSIENPVRRGGNLLFPLNDMKEISAFCRTEGIPLHLDGARIHIAATWSGVPIAEYASYFDTVYISLYKYLGAAGGAVLCGSQAVIAPMQRLIKIHGGNLFHAWPFAAIALHYLDSIDERLRLTKERTEELMVLLNKMKNFGFKPLPGGTNTYNLGIPMSADPQKFRQLLFDNEKITLGAVGDRGYIACTVNESILKRPAAEIAEAMVKAAKEGKK